MSFLDLLKKSREEAQQQVQQIANKIIETSVIEDKLEIIQQSFDIEKKKVDIDGDGKSHPEKYFTGLDEKTKHEREAEIERRKEEGIKPPQLYADLPGDKESQTKPSKYTKTSGAAAIREETKDNSKDEFIRAASKVSGVSRSIIEEVYDKGLKAWSTSGHRPGATAQQWAIARVYAFLFDAKSGARKADKHLWDKHLNAKKSIESDTIIDNKTIYNIKGYIVKTLKYALKQCDKKYHTSKFEKNAQRLLTNNQLYFKDFEYCWTQIKHRDPNRLDYHLLGGAAMIQLQKYMDDGITLQEALELQYEEMTNE